jgi:hypothetical protein
MGSDNPFHRGAERFDQEGVVELGSQSCSSQPSAIHKTDNPTTITDSTVHVESGMSQDELETALKAARWYRDLGNTILVVGIFAEILIEAIWPDAESSEDHSFASRFSKWWKGHFWKGKNIAILFAGLVTLSGLWLERAQGTKADDVADQIRTSLEHTIISLSPRWQLLRTEEVQKRLIAKLELFKGQKIAIYRTAPSEFDEGMTVAELNSVLELAGWVNPWGNPISKLVKPKESIFTNVFSCCSNKRQQASWGIGIETAADAPEATREAARALISALKAEDLDTLIPLPEVGPMYGPIEGTPTDSQTIIVTFGKSVVQTF